MDNDRIKGKVNQVKGKFREEVSDVTGDTSGKMKGKFEQAGGKLQQGYGKAKDELRASQKKGEERRERQDIDIDSDVDSDL